MSLPGLSRIPSRVSCRRTKSPAAIRKRRISHIGKVMFLFFCSFTILWTIVSPPHLVLLGILAHRDQEIKERGSPGLRRGRSPPGGGCRRRPSRGTLP